MPELPVKFQEFPAEMFPFTVIYLDAVTGEEVRRDVISGPGVYEVPGFKPRSVRVRVVYADGTVSDAQPRG
jgi:hypothetical protein